MTSCPQKIYIALQNVFVYHLLKGIFIVVILFKKVLKSLKGMNTLVYSVYNGKGYFTVFADKLNNNTTPIRWFQQQLDGRLPVWVCYRVCDWLCLSFMTYPWAAEGAGGEARRGSTNRPRPVAKTSDNTQRSRGNLKDQPVACNVFQ